MAITTSDTDPFVLMHTPPTDQAALFGLINRLNGLGMRLLSVEQL